MHRQSERSDADSAARASGSGSLQPAIFRANLQLNSHSAGHTHERSFSVFYADTSGQRDNCLIVSAGNENIMLFLLFASHSLLLLIIYIVTHCSIFNDDEWSVSVHNCSSTRILAATNEKKNKRLETNFYWQVFQHNSLEGTSIGYLIELKAPWLTSWRQQSVNDHSESFSGNYCCRYYSKVQTKHRTYIRKAFIRSIYINTSDYLLWLLWMLCVWAVDSMKTGTLLLWLIFPQIIGNFLTLRTLYF